MMTTRFFCLMALAMAVFISSHLPEHGGEVGRGAGS
jgi:hypothetical protein